MDDVKLEGSTYRLRAGSPMPIGGKEFILQTFMGEESKVTNYLYTEFLPGSEEFRGQGGQGGQGEEAYVSASFTRLLDSSGDSYTGKIVKDAVPVPER